MLRGPRIITRRCTCENVHRCWLWRCGAGLSLAVKNTTHGFIAVRLSYVSTSAAARARVAAREGVGSVVAADAGGVPDVEGAVVIEIFNSGSGLKSASVDRLLLPYCGVAGSSGSATASGSMLPPVRAVRAACSWCFGHCLLLLLLWWWGWW